MKKFRKFLAEMEAPVPTQGNPGQGTGIDPRMFDPKLNPPIELDPRYRGSNPPQPTVLTDEQYYDIIEEMLRQLNAGCPASNPCVSAAEIRRIRREMQDVIRYMREGRYGNNLPNNGIGLIWSIFLQLITQTDIWHDVFYAPDGTLFDGTGEPTGVKPEDIFGTPNF